MAFAITAGKIYHDKIQVRKQIRFDKLRRRADFPRSTELADVCMRIRRLYIPALVIRSSRQFLLPEWTMFWDQYHCALYGDVVFATSLFWYDITFMLLIQNTSAHICQYTEYCKKEGLPWKELAVANL
jgi:hypothetical protein